MGSEIPHRHGGLDIQGCGVSVSIDAATPLQPDAAREALSKLVSEIAKRSVSEGALAIGHVKAILRAGNEFVHADTIGEKYGTFVSGRLARPLGSAELTVNSIIVGLKSDAIERLTLEAVRGQFVPRGAKVEVMESSLHGRHHEGENGHESERDGEGEGEESCHRH